MFVPAFPEVRVEFRELAQGREHVVGERFLRSTVSIQSHRIEHGFTIRITITIAQSHRTRDSDASSRSLGAVLLPVERLGEVLHHLQPGGLHREQRPATTSININQYEKRERELLFVDEVSEEQRAEGVDNAKVVRGWVRERVRV